MNIKTQSGLVFVAALVAAAHSVAAEPGSVHQDAFDYRNLRALQEVYDIQVTGDAQVHLDKIGGGRLRFAMAKDETATATRTGAEFTWGPDGKLSAEIEIIEAPRFTPVSLIIESVATGQQINAEWMVRHDDLQVSIRNPALAAGNKAVLLLKGLPMHDVAQLWRFEVDGEWGRLLADRQDGKGFVPVGQKVKHQVDTSGFAQGIRVRIKASRLSGKPGVVLIDNFKVSGALLLPNEPT